MKKVLKNNSNGIGFLIFVLPLLLLLLFFVICFTLLYFFISALSLVLADTVTWEHTYHMCVSSGLILMLVKIFKGIEGIEDIQKVYDENIY